MIVPLNSPLPQNSSTPPSASDIAAQQAQLAAFGQGVSNAQISYTWVVDPNSFSDVSALAPTVVAEAQQVVADQQQSGLAFAPAALQLSSGGAVISDDDIAGAPQIVPMNPVTDIAVVIPNLPATKARKHIGTKWGDAAVAALDPSQDCELTAAASAVAAQSAANGGTPSGTSWAWLAWLAAGMAALYVLDDNTKAYF